MRIASPPRSPLASAGQLLCALAALALGGCGDESPRKSVNTAEPAPPEAADDAADHVKVFDIWIPAGQAWERDVMRDFVHDFNSSQQEIQVELGILPNDVYHEVVQQAAEADDLPDLLQFDSPYVARYAWQEMLLPLDEMLSEEILADLLPSVISQGTYRDRLYAVSLTDTGLGLYLNPKKLREISARIPRGVDDAWTAEEFDDILAALSERSGGRPVLDLKLNYGNDWFCYAFLPVLVSAGAHFIDGETQRADGVVNGAAAVEAMTRVQSWFQKGYVDPNQDDNAFAEERVAISLSGPWDYRRNDLALDGALLLAPLPDFGHGTRTAQGAWTWGITRNARHPEAVIRFLEFMLRSDNMIRLTEVTGAVPARMETVARSSHFGEGAPLHLFVRQLHSTAVPRPQTPAYPVIEKSFEIAFNKIGDGSDVQETLDELAQVIDEEIARNDGYADRRPKEMAGSGRE